MLSLIISSSHLKLSHQLSSFSSSSHLSHQLSSLKLSSPSHAVAVAVTIPAVPTHFHLSHLSSSHLQAMSSPSLFQSTLISLICQALISLISQALISQPTPSPSQPLPMPSHTVLDHASAHAIPAHASTRSTSSQCSLFFCSEFFNLCVCCFGLIFLGLVLFCGEKWCCPYVVLGKIKKNLCIGITS